MRCRQDNAQCVVRPGSARGRTCNRCKTKKAACSLNKGEGSTMPVGSAEVVDLLTKLVRKVDGLAEAVDEMKEEMAGLRGRVDDLVSDFHTDDIDSPADLLDSDDEAWKASCLELNDLYSVNSEALRKVMQWRLDEDMAHLRSAGPLQLEIMDATDPYEISNQEFWHGYGGPGTIEELKKRRGHFQKTCAEFYTLGGRHKEWMFWKEDLRALKCEEFLVEDSDLEEEVRGGEIREEMGPLGGGVGIEALDRVIMDADGESGEVGAAGPSNL